MVHRLVDFQCIYGTAVVSVKFKLVACLERQITEPRRDIWSEGVLLPEFTIWYCYFLAVTIVLLESNRGDFRKKTYGGHYFKKPTWSSAITVRHLTLNQTAPFSYAPKAV